MNFDKLTQKNAREFFGLYLSRKDEVLAEFKRRSEMTGGPKILELNFSPESLLPLMKWVRSRMPFASAHPQGDFLPPWYAFELVTNPHSTTTYFTPEAAANIDGLAYYWGDFLVQNMPNASWQIDPYKQSFNFCKPTVWNDYFSNYPLGYAIGIARKYNKDPNDQRISDDAMLTAFRECQADADDYRKYVEGGGKPDHRMKKKVLFE